MSPKPYWILRQHGSTSIRTLHHAHPLLACGDDAGVVSLVDLLTLRPRFKWSAHTDSLLTVLVIRPDQILTHARDNTVKLWKLPVSNPAVGISTSSDAEPELVKTLEVNALNFAKCSHHSGRIAVPNTLDAAYIDLLDLTTGHRLHEAIGKPDIKPASRLPIVMSLHLLPPHVVVAGYEDGYVKKWRNGSLEWSARCHSESVMSMAISPAHGYGVSVGADDRIARFDLEQGTTQLVQTRTPGKASVAIAPNGETFVVGAWDGSIKVYSATTMSELGSLPYHRDTVECLAFAHAPLADDNGEDGSDDDEQDGSQVPQLVLAAGGRDGKISLWKYH